MFNIFYGELSYELVEQIPSYDLGALLGMFNQSLTSNV